MSLERLGQCSSAVGADVYACSRGGYIVVLSDIHFEGLVFHLRKVRESNLKNTSSKHAHILDVVSTRG